MGVLSLVNHFGTFLLFVAMVLLIVASISAPTVSSISLFTVNLGGGGSGEITFGTFGYCVRGLSNGGCSGTSIGYNPTEVVSTFGGIDFSDFRENSVEALTNVMILHPVGAGVAFIALALSLGSSFFGSFLSSLVAGLTFIITTVALICDFVWIAAVRRNVNRNSSGANSHYDAALWCVLAAAVCSLIASVILFFTCCSGRAKNRRAERRKVDYHSPPATTHTRRRWWSRNRY